MRDSDNPIDRSEPTASGAFSFAIGENDSDRNEADLDGPDLDAPDLDAPGSADDAEADAHDDPRFALNDLAERYDRNDDDTPLTEPSGEDTDDESAVFDGASAWTLWLAWALIAIGLLFVAWALISG